jgi:hypothetical protein
MSAAAAHTSSTTPTLFTKTQARSVPLGDILVHFPDMKSVRVWDGDWDSQ